MRLSLLFLAVATLLASVSVSAQQVYFSTGESLRSSYDTVRLELVSPTVGTASFATDSAYYQALTAHPQALFSNFMVTYPTAALRFTYDAATAPSVATESGAYYSTGAIVAQLSDIYGEPTTLQASNPFAWVGDMPAGRFFLAGGSPVSASPLAYHDPIPRSVKVDLVSLIASSYNVVPGTGFDLSAFSSLPAHLTAPGEYRAVSMNLSLSAFAADPPEAPNLSLPESFDLSIYYNANFSISFEGDFTLALDATDFATPEAFAAAQAWLAANPMQLDAQSNLVFNVTALNPQDGGWGGPLGLGADWYVPSAVPEPASGMLWFSGLMFGAGLLRSRRRNLLRGRLKARSAA